MDVRVVAKLLILLVAVVACMGLAVALLLEPAAKGGSGRILAAAVVGLVAGGLLTYALFRTSFQTWRSIEEGARRLGRGEWEMRIPLAGHNEFTQLGALLNTAARQLHDRLETIEEEQERLRTILESMAEGVMVVDADGLVGLVNASFRTIFETPPLHAGQTVLELVRHADLQEAVDAVLAGTEVVTRELHLSQPREKVLAAHLARIRGGKGRFGVVAVFHDITKIKRLERVRQEFVANVSHELRTPLTSIQGYTETLLRGALDDPATARGFLEVMQRNAQQLAALVEDILTLSRIESSTAPFEVQPCALGTLAAEAMQLMEGVAAKKRIALDAARPFPEATIMADRGALLQALTNLLDNAIKYTPEGGKVSLRMGCENGQVWVAVEDTGIGIEPRHLDRIFERFYRVDRYRSRQLGGTGLGLSIVKHIVQAHGGEVTVRSVPRRGSTFTISLPLYALAEEHPPSEMS